MIKAAREWLVGIFNISGNLPVDIAHIPSTPEQAFYPGHTAPLIDHVRFLLEAKNYVAQHQVPPEREGSFNQYSHAGRAPIGDDRTKPAITNCSYEYFGRKLVSIGFPMFVKMAPGVKDDQINPAFNNITLWESFSKLLTQHAGDLGDSDAKYGYYLPTNHYYIEKPVREDVFNRAQKVIDFYTCTDIQNPARFLQRLKEEMAQDTPAVPTLPIHHLQ